MAKKTKIETQKQADSAVPNPVGAGPAKVIATRSKSSVAILKPKKTKATPKKRKAATLIPAASKVNPPSAIVAEPSDEQIRLRAYFIAERRLRLSLPGDSANDWIEAKRQLIAEAAPR